MRDIDDLLQWNPEPTITLGDLHKLRHMLGVGSHIARRKWGYRNGYSAPIRDYLKALEDAQLVKFNVAIPQEHSVSGFLYYWSATLAGAQLVGLSAAAIRRLGLEVTP